MYLVYLHTTQYLFTTVQCAITFSIPALSSLLQLSQDSWWAQQYAESEHWLKRRRKYVSRILLESSQGREARSHLNIKHDRVEKKLPYINWSNLKHLRFLVANPFSVPWNGPILDSVSCILCPICYLNNSYFINQSFLLQVLQLWQFLQLSGYYCFICSLARSTLQIGHTK